MPLLFEGMILPAHGQVFALGRFDFKEVRMFAGI